MEMFYLLFIRIQALALGNQDVASAGTEDACGQRPQTRLMFCSVSLDVSSRGPEAETLGTEKGRT